MTDAPILPEIDLSELDVLGGGGYPSDVVAPDERRRWSQSRLIALLIACSAESDMPNTQYIYTQVQSTYQQSEFATETDAELAQEIADAQAEGWL